MMSKELDKIYQAVCKISGAENPEKTATAEIILKELSKIEKEINSKSKDQQKIEKRVNEVVKVLMAFANLDYSKKAPLTNSGDYIDAVASGINMLGEELESSTVSLREKEVLLKEVHHRVKNNLQVISSLLSLQSDFIKDKDSLDRFLECRNRVKSMALIHEQLYKSKELSKIEFGNYLSMLVDSLNASYGFLKSDKIVLQIESPLHYLKVDTAIPCGLIINELLTNSYKYAFSETKKGTIKILVSKQSLLSKNDLCQLIVEDDGIGISPDIDVRNTKTLGLQLVHMLVEQLDGTIRLDRSTGTKFIITLHNIK